MAVELLPCMIREQAKYHDTDRHCDSRPRPRPDVDSSRGAGNFDRRDVTRREGQPAPVPGSRTEEINHGYDGGLYAELVQNRAFLDNAKTPVHWSVVQGDGAAAAIALDASQPLNTAIGTSLRLD